MKQSDRVSRNADQQADATVVEIQGDHARISYDEGGEGWWPINSLVAIDYSDWSSFKRQILVHPGVNALMASALLSAPNAALGIPTALFRASEGDPTDFLACWRAILAAAAGEKKALVAELSAIAAACNLPSDFIDAIEGR